jgi:hypothetical protein
MTLEAGTPPPKSITSATAAPATARSPAAAAMVSAMASASTVGPRAAVSACPPRAATSPAGLPTPSAGQPDGEGDENKDREQNADKDAQGAHEERLCGFAGTTKP